MKRVLRDLAIVVIIILVLGAIGLIDIRVQLSPGETIICIAPVGSCP